MERDKKNSSSNVKYLLIFSGFLIMLIPLIQSEILEAILSIESPELRLPGGSVAQEAFFSE